MGRRELTRRGPPSTRQHARPSPRPRVHEPRLTALKVPAGPCCAVRTGKWRVQTPRASRPRRLSPAALPHLPPLPPLSRPIGAAPLTCRAWGARDPLSGAHGSRAAQVRWAGRGPLRPRAWGPGPAPRTPVETQGGGNKPRPRGRPLRLRMRALPSGLRVPLRLLALGSRPVQAWKGASIVILSVLLKLRWQGLVIA